MKQSEIYKKSIVAVMESREIPSDEKFEIVLNLFRKFDVERMLEGAEE